MMSLLLTFFIMLVSMSELKEDGKLRMMLDALQERFGLAPGSIGVPGRSVQSSSAYPELASRGMTSEGGLKKASVRKSHEKDSSRGGAHPTVERISHGDVVTLGGPAAFEAFDPEPSEPLKRELRVLAKILGPVPNEIVVRGHTTAEPVPRDARFRDRWELSFRRALNVAEFLVAEGIDRKRLIVEASAASEPRSQGGRKSQAYNRRVDVFLIESYRDATDGVSHP
jgi:chemotaxis protein MotB